MSTNKEFALMHLGNELEQLQKAQPASSERALHLGIVLGAVSAYRNLGVLGDLDLNFMAGALGDEDEKQPMLGAVYEARKGGPDCHDRFTS